MVSSFSSFHSRDVGGVEVEASETVHGKSEGKEEQKRGCLPLDEVNWSCVIEWWRGSMLRGRFFIFDWVT